MRGEKQRGYFRHGKSRDALTSYLPANQRVASQARGPWSQSSVDLPPFWLRNSKLRWFSEYHHSSATQPMIHMVSPFILGFWGRIDAKFEFQEFSRNLWESGVILPHVRESPASPSFWRNCTIFLLLLKSMISLWPRAHFPTDNVWKSGNPWKLIYL